MARVVLGVSLPVVVLFAVLFATGCTRQSANSQEITTLVTELGANQHSNEDVRGLMRQARFHELTLHEESPNEWNIEAPLEFGAKNWILHIEFRDSKVAALRVRTADDKDEHPKNAPEDKVFSHQ